MKLHTVIGSPNCRKVQAVIGHLGLDVEYAYYDFFSGELGQADYLTVNPNGLVPTLEDGDLVLNESNAIMIYLTGKVQGTSLFPDQAKARAEIVRWLFWETAHFNRAFGGLCFEAVVRPAFGLGEPNEHLIAQSKEGMAKFTPVLEKHMTGRTYLVGDKVTIADFAMACNEKFKDPVPFDWAPYPSVSAYLERMRNHPSWAATAPASDAEIGRRPIAA